MTEQNTARKIFVSYKYKDMNVLPVAGYTPSVDTGYYYTPRHYVDKIIDTIGKEHIYKGELGGEDLSHLTDDTIDSKLKEKIFDSSVTVVLLSPNMFDRTKHEKEQWIPNEISYSLRNKTRGERTSKTNGMLAVALPDRNGNYDYAVVDLACGVRSWQTNSFFKMLHKNMFNRVDKNHNYCHSCAGYHHFGIDHSFVHQVKWADFITDYNTYIDRALEIRDKLDEFDITVKHE